MTSDASHPPTDRESPDASGSAVADRTATDVFASLAADGPSVDTDAILDGTTPEEIIDRTDEPAPSTSVHHSLIDEGELTELILPDRRDEGSFRWVETTESASRSDDDGTPSSTFDTFLDADDGTDPSRKTAPDSAPAMTDSTETRTADGSASTTTDGAPGFETDGPSSGGKVPPHTAAPSANRESEGSGAEPKPSRSAAETATPDDQPPTEAAESGMPSADAAGESEIRTTVQYFDHRKPDRSPDGLLASAKARLSRLFRPGRSG